MVVKVNKNIINKIRHNIIVKDKKWNNINDTNCYAYALNLDLSCKEINDDRCFYNVGYISSCYKRILEKEELINALINDMKKLGISIKEVDFNYILEENEWKIALFKTDVYVDDKGRKSTDFHFIRKNYDGYWSHKVGWKDRPEKLENRKDILIAPERLNLMIEDNDGIPVKYNYIGTYRLKKKKLKF